MFNNLLSYFSVKKDPLLLQGNSLEISSNEQLEILNDKTTNEEITNENINESYEIVNCNHDFVDYDQQLLLRMHDEIESKRDSQINRIANKINNLNELDNKILDLLVKWYPVSPSTHGKCMTCNKTVTVCYSMNKFIIYA